MCEIQCIIPDGSTLLRSSANVAVKKEDGTIICTACSEICDWASSVVSVNKATTTVNSKKDPSINSKIIDKTIKSKSNTNNANNVGNMVHCPKCNEKFGTRVCKCGFKNPLYRK